MKRCIIVNLEPDSLDRPEEPMVKMFKMLITSLRCYGGKHKDIPVFGVNFSSQDFKKEDKIFFKKNNVEIITNHSFLFLTSNSPLVIGRHLAPIVLGSEKLKEYDELIYLDVDVLILNEPIFHEKLSSSIVTDQIAFDYLSWEKNYAKYNEIHKRLKHHSPYRNYYSQWIGNINQYNFNIYEKIFHRIIEEKELHNNIFPRWGSVIMNEIIFEEKIQVLHPKTMSGIMPYRDTWDEESSIIHYD